MELKDYRRHLLEDPKVAAAHRRLQPKLELGRQILDLRLRRGRTQGELAQQAGTRQANISRLENARLNPSADTLQRVPDALGVQLAVSLCEPDACACATGAGEQGHPVHALG